jgi:hypothetical protein
VLNSVQQKAGLVLGIACQVRTFAETVENRCSLLADFQHFDESQSYMGDSPDLTLRSGQNRHRKFERGSGR